jgi:hypothetical protein
VVEDLSASEWSFQLENLYVWRVFSKDKEVEVRPNIGIISYCHRITEDDSNFGDQFLALPPVEASLSDRCLLPEV